MLARLDAVPGVLESRADASGRFFALALSPGAEPDLTLARALAALGGGARALGEDEARGQLAASERGDPWYARRDSLALCFLEARVLSVRIGAAAAEAARLPGRDRERVAEVARAVLFEAMERVHGEGGRPSSGWFYEEWPAVARRISQGCRAFLAEEDLAGVSAALARLF